MARKTPLHSKHLSLSAKMVDFAGWNMPVVYSSVIEEHQAVRNAIGLFDISHMGEIEVRGSESVTLLQELLVGDISQMYNGQVLYSLMCLPTGGIIDDLLVYRFSQEHFMLCVNASNSEKDYEWIKRHEIADSRVTDLSAETALLAVQGSKAERLLGEIFDLDLPSLKYYEFRTLTDEGKTILVSRTGYTGEDGFEIYLDTQQASGLWDKIMEKGEPYGIRPIGLAARDTLRLEMKYPLYGSDMSEATTPFDACLGWAVKINKGNFIGSDVLKRQKEKGIKKRLVGFVVIEKGIPRAHYSIYSGEKKIGEVTSGTHSPTLNKGIGTGYIDTEYSVIGTEIEIEIRRKRVKAKIVKPPFYASRVKKI